jgi:hypothetical protein
MPPSLLVYANLSLYSLMISWCSAPTFESHVEHLKQVFDWLRRDQWKLKKSKCSFAQQSISYLGHVISADGLSTDPTKVRAIVDWPVPTNVRELYGFLGLAGYY